jgi:putative heme-binding domain-containing protein
MKIIFILLFAAAAMAQTAVTKNPRTTPKDVAAGAGIFRSHCAQCHGLTAEGGRGPNLANGIFFHGSTDAELHRNISDGIPGTEMPGVFFSDNQVWQVVAFVRSLSDKTAKIRVSGDVAAGEAIFRGKGGCVQCHRVGGQGGRLGPDLGMIGSLRSPDHLRTSILDPSAEVPPRYWIFKVKEKGQSYTGFALNEDTYTLQMIDLGERLHAFAKLDLGEITVEKTSSMPSFQGSLEETELRNLVAYLSSLRRKGSGQ